MVRGRGGQRRQRGGRSTGGVGTPLCAVSGRCGRPARCTSARTARCPHLPARRLLRNANSSVESHGVRAKKLTTPNSKKPEQGPKYQGEREGGREGGSGRKEPMLALLPIWQGTDRSQCLQMVRSSPVIRSNLSLAGDAVPRVPQAGPASGFSRPPGGSVPPTKVGVATPPPIEGVPI